MLRHEIARGLVVMPGRDVSLVGKLYLVTITDLLLTGYMQTQIPLCKLHPQATISCRCGGVEVMAHDWIALIFR